MSIAVIAGLGNPGPEYARTRHNLGFWLVDALARESGAVWKSESRFQAEVARAEVAGHAVWLLKPQTFMNESGLAVGPFLRFHQLPANALAVVHDDITLPLGRLKISVRGSDGGHNGIASLLAHAGADFTRVKLGIGSKAHPEMDLADHVLSRLTPAEEAALAARLPDYLAGLRLLVAAGPDEAMNQFNRIKN
ncbi:MAG TPA: aminoacyl-tRNA hydrolase [Opitutales bacterium]|nr:aminoacyl-tRNA hydrolase [Opitutales bacterium]